MIIRCLRAFVPLLLFVPGACFGQGATKVFAHDTAKDQSSKEQIVKMTEEVLAAEVRGDVPAMDRAFTDNYIHTHASGLVQNKAEFLGEFKPGAHKYNAADISQVQVRFFGTSAIINGHELVNDHHYSFLAVWLQEQGKWRLAAWVASPDPKNPRGPGTAK